MAEDEIKKSDYFANPKKDDKKRPGRPPGRKNNKTLEAEKMRKENEMKKAQSKKSKVSKKGLDATLEMVLPYFKDKPRANIDEVTSWIEGQKGESIDPATLDDVFRMNDEMFLYNGYDIRMRKSAIMKSTEALIFVEGANRFYLLRHDGYYSYVEELVIHGTDMADTPEEMCEYLDEECERVYDGGRWIGNVSHYYSIDSNLNVREISKDDMRQNAEMFKSKTEKSKVSKSGFGDILQAIEDVGREEHLTMNKVLREKYNISDDIYMFMSAIIQEARYIMDGMESVDDEDFEKSKTKKYVRGDKEGLDGLKWALEESHNDLDKIYSRIYDYAVGYYDTTETHQRFDTIFNGINITKDAILKAFEGVEESEGTYKSKTEKSVTFKGYNGTWTPLAKSGHYTMWACNEEPNAYNIVTKTMKQKSSGKLVEKIVIEDVDGFDDKRVAKTGLKKSELSERISEDLGNKIMVTDRADSVEVWIPAQGGSNGLVLQQAMLDEVVKLKSEGYSIQLFNGSGGPINRFVVIKR